jgi:hypothetical protein
VFIYESNGCLCVHQYCILHSSFLPSPSKSFALFPRYCVDLGLISYNSFLNVLLWERTCLIFHHRQLAWQLWCDIVGDRSVCTDLTIWICCIFHKIVVATNPMIWIHILWSSGRSMCRNASSDILAYILSGMGNKINNWLIKLSLTCSLLLVICSLVLGCLFIGHGQLWPAVG